MIVFAKQELVNNKNLKLFSRYMNFLIGFNKWVMN